MIMCRADGGKTRAEGTVQVNVRPAAARFIHHLVSYTVTGIRETGYGTMTMSDTVEFFM